MVAKLKASGYRAMEHCDAPVMLGTDFPYRPSFPFAHDGPAPVDVRAARQELWLPPKLTYGQIKGFTLYATRTVLSGEGSELTGLAP